MKGTSRLLLVLGIYACEGRERSSRGDRSSFRGIVSRGVYGQSKYSHSTTSDVDYDGFTTRGRSFDVSGNAEETYSHEELEYLQQEQLVGQGGLSSIVPMTAKEEQRLRYLQGGIPTFTPLTCNENIAEADCTATRLSVLVANSIGGGGVDEVTIPCGTCAYWDYDQSSSGFEIAPGGINIIGKLHIPSTAHGTLKFPHMIIQGVLQIDPPAPGNLVKFLLYGSEDVFFHPHPDNAHVCDATNGCKVGKKPIAVAGGVLQVRGIDAPEDCPSWVKLRDIIDVDRKTIEVGTDAASCWNIGDEVLLTSPLKQYSFRAVATIESIDALAGMLTLTESLPEYFVEATEVADPDFCVEVASLTRRVVFDAEKDDTTNNYKIGGHLMVLLTPHVAQTLEGVELQNFGQQGNLGRYPIHFHLCANVYGSYVSKNVIRNSNQRCVVIHGSNDVHIYDNVAFETHGHCYFTEDGIETGNIFERNLGASTMKPEFVIAGENDNRPSTFWITNTQNHWMDNVAAGGDFAGVWFDTRTKVRGPSYEGNENYEPIYLPLATFRDNIAHSNKARGIALYSPGYKPAVEAVLENTKTYRNTDGWFVHGNRNVAIIGGIVSDNKMGFNNFRASNLRFENMTIIGYSEAYERVRAIQDEAHLCLNNAGTDFMVGMSIHPWRNLPTLGTEWGAAVKNVVFRRFGPETFCTDSNTGAIEMSTKQVQLHHDCPNRFANIVFEAGIKRIDACAATHYGIENLSIEDVDGSLSPTGTAGFFVSDHLAMTTFAGGTSACTPVFGSCLVFCEGACLRQVTFKVSNTLSTQNIEMVISNGVESATTEWRQFDSHKDEEVRNKVNTHGIFAATVPAGNYDISFRYIETGAPAWPDYVYVEHEVAPECNNFQPVINLLKPPVISERCSELIKDGDFEDGTFDAWHQDSAELQITTEWSTTSSYALRVIKRNGNTDGASQSLDVSCLVEGFTYELTADIRLEDDKNAGVETFCDPANGDCPVVMLSFYSWDTASKTATSTSNTIGTVVSSQQENSWYKIEGTITLTAQEASADRVELTFEKPKNKNHIIDNVRFWTGDVHDPTVSPTVSPTGAPTFGPTASATVPPTDAPTLGPTYHEFGATEDAYLRSNREGTGYGVKQTVQVLDGTHVRKIILKFDLGQHVPSGAASIGAKLQLFVTFVGSDESRTIEVRRVGETPTWDEAIVTWESYHSPQPSTVQICTNQLVVSTSDVNSVVEVEIGDIVDDKVAEGGGLLVLEMAIIGGDSSNNGNKVIFRSNEGEAAVSLQEPGPKLVVTTGAVEAGIR